MVINTIESSGLSIFLIVLAILTGLGLLIIGLFSWLFRRKMTSKRLDHFIDPQDHGSTETQFVPRELTGTLLNRTIISWMETVVQFLERFTPSSLVGEIEHKLAMAGHPANLHASEYYALRFMALITGVGLAVLLNRDLARLSLNNLFLGTLLVIGFWLLPELWLKGRIRTRQKEISRTLPDALDMLSVCVSAGMGFDQSLKKISHVWDTDLGYEFNKVVREIEMGVSRRDALKNLGSRLEVEELSHFIALIVQAEKVGMSYADVLHTQALQLRVMRQFKAKEIANKLPGKMIFPLAVFIFPAMIAVILGPALPTLMNIF